MVEEAEKKTLRYILRQSLSRLGQTLERELQQNTQAVYPERNRHIENHTERYKKNTGLDEQPAEENTRRENSRGENVGIYKG